MDSYLEIARTVLQNSRQPLSARQILKAALQMQLVPRDLYGRTQHKTLQARLATDILKHRSKSAFYRTGPGRFFLRSYMRDESIPSSYRQEFQAPLRANQLGRYDVVAFPSKSLARLALSATGPFSIADLFKLPWRFAPLNLLRKQNKFVPFRFLLLLKAKDDIFVDNRRIEKADGDLSRQAVIGIDGVVKCDDLSLFSSDEFGLWDAAARTLFEHLELPPNVRPRLEEMERWSRPQAVIDIDDHSIVELMIYLAFECTDIDEIEEAVRSRGSAEWFAYPIKINDIDRFDKWSKRLIEDEALKNALAAN